MSLIQKNEVVGIVTNKEKYVAQRLYERILGLQELLPVTESKEISLEEKNHYYEKIIKDLSNTKRNLQEWWNTMYLKYKWKGDTNYRWQINFETNEIILQK